MGLLENPLFLSLVMVLWGIAVKYIPLLKPWPNHLIAYMNVLIGIITKLAIPEEAHAAGFFASLGLNLGWLLPGVQALIARNIYEGFLRPLIEHYFPEAAKAASQNPKARAHA